MLNRAIAIVAFGVFVVAASVDNARAFSEPIPMKISLLKWGGNPPVGKLFKMVSKAPNPPLFPIPEPGPSDPVSLGASLDVVLSGGTGSSGTLSCDLQAGAWDGSRGWKALGNPAGSKGYKYINKGAPNNDPCKIAIIKEKVIKVLAKSVGTITEPADSGNGDIGIFLTVGGDGYCASAVAPHFKEKADTLIKMKDEPAPLTCTRCGDNAVNWAGEECDGTDDSACPGRCIPAGSGGVCGDGVVNGGEECTCQTEECDGAATERSDCPGACAPNCVCPTPVCGNGAKEVGEDCDPPCEQGACDAGEICGGFCQCVPDVPCDCGSPEPTRYEFTPKPPTEAVCGSTDGQPPIDDLACMGLYIGGGGGSLAVPNMIPDEATPKYDVSCCQGTDMAITATTQADVGRLHCTEGKKCSATSTNAGAPCRRDRDCDGGSCETRCLFAAPVEVFDQELPPISVCTVIEIVEDSVGGVNCETGESYQSLPIDGRLFLTILDKSPSTPGFQACPICFGGELGVPNSGTCEGGINNGLLCTPQSTSYDTENCCAGGLNNAKPCSDHSDCPGSTCQSGCTQYPTSHDCPPHPLSEVGVIPIPFALTTGTSSRTANANGDFCGWCRDVDGDGSLCFEGDKDDEPSPGAKSCPDSATIACRPTTYHSDPPVGGDPADILECDDPVPCNTNADCTEPYETCQQRSPGAFRDATVRDISYQGTPGGDLRTPGEHRATTVNAFCIGPAFNPDADFSGDIGGPAGISLEIDMQLSPSGAFMDTAPALLD